MIGLITTSQEGVKRITILSEDTDVKELMSSIKDCEYTLIPICNVSYKVYDHTSDLKHAIYTIESMYNDDTFRSNLTDKQSKTFQELLDAFDKVSKDLF